MNLRKARPIKLLAKARERIDNAITSWKESVGTVEWIGLGAVLIAVSILMFAGKMVLERNQELGVHWIHHSKFL